MKYFKQFLKTRISFITLFVLGVSFLFLFEAKIYATDWLITNSGNYKLGYDILSSGDANGTIRIQSSYVNLDLNGLFIKQTTSTAGCTGIVVDSNFTDITIKNGTVFNFTGNGIQVGAGCQKIILDNILTDSCFLSGITFVGTPTVSGGSPITDSKIQNSRILRCANSATAGSPAGVPPVWLKNCNRCYVGNCQITTSGIFQVVSSNNTYGCVELDSCDSCLVENVNMYNNQQYGAVVFNLFPGATVASTGCVVRNCIYSGSSGALFAQTDFTASGFSVVSQFLDSIFSSKIIFLNCLATNNNNAGVAGYFSTGSGTSNIIFQGCVVSQCFSSNFVYGFYCTGDFVTFIDCVASDNVIASGAGSLYAFNLAGEKNSMIRCLARNNIGTGVSDEVAGVQNGGIDVVIRDCEFSFNYSGSDTLSYGILDQGSVNSLYLHNIAFRNGPTSPLIANQMSGVPIGSTTTPGGGGAGSASTRISSAMSPWGNLRMTS